MSVRSSFKVAPIALVALFCSTGALAPTSSEACGAPAPEVLSPDSLPFGLTYGAWGARFWQWAFSIPASANPLNDTAPCSEGQSGPVWFLGGAFTTNDPGTGVVTGTADRACSVPAGKALFIPVVNSECSQAEANGDTEAELRDCSRCLLDHVTQSDLEVDGVHVDPFVADSPLFQFGPLLDDNLIGVPAGTISPSVANGQYILLAPLASGAHTVHFSSVAELQTGDCGVPSGFTFVQNITYHLAIAPGGEEP